MSQNVMSLYSKSIIRTVNEALLTAVTIELNTINETTQSFETDLRNRFSDLTDIRQTKTQIKIVLGGGTRFFIGVGGAF